MIKFGRALAALLAVFTTVVGTTSAGAQPGRPGWSEDMYAVRESQGQIVVSLSFFRPGRVVYRTVPVSAQSPADFTSVSGEVVFTGGDTKTIQIPIVDDSLAEDAHGDDEFGRYEEFTLEAWEEPAPDPFPGGTTARVRILDDDEVGDAAVGPATPGGVSTVRPTSGGQIATTAPSGRDVTSPPTTATPASPVVDPTADTTAEALQPGPGFELPTSQAERSSPGTNDGRDSSVAQLVGGLGAAGLGAGSLAWARRRRRWSATRA